MKMRELKFRIWYKEGYGEKMVYDLTPDKWANKIPTNINQCGILMQYTGLKDKNGKEIYEGDIVCFGNNNPVEVVFDNGCFNIFDEPLGWNFDEEFNPIKTDFKYCEIIGNIYENPELLK